jgi:hypothetical protein
MRGHLPTDLRHRLRSIAEPGPDSLGDVTGGRIQREPDDAAPIRIEELPTLARTTMELGPDR